MVNDEQQKADNEMDETAAEPVLEPTGAGDGEPEEPTAAEEAADAAEAAAEAADDILDAELSLEHVQAELEAAKDAALRAQAEALNARRRSEQDVEKARKYALERFAGEILSVVDNLERALAAAGDDEATRPIAEGVDLTLKGLVEVLGKFNIAAHDPTGEPFDPQLHQAMTMVPNPDMEPNTVMDVMQKGYTLNGRLIRPAMVVVSKAPE